MRTYIFKVELSEDPPIWRDIEIRADQTLHDLHEAIFRAYNRDDDHMYSFFLTNKPWDASGEYAHPLAGAEGDAAKTTVEELGLRRGKVFLYVFDYGDEWWHRITLLDKHEEAEEGEDVVYPRVIAAEGESPPQYWDEEDWEEDEDEEDE